MSYSVSPVNTFSPSDYLEFFIYFCFLTKKTGTRYIGLADFIATRKIQTFILGQPPSADGLRREVIELAHPPRGEWPITFLLGSVNRSVQLTMLLFKMLISVLLVMC